MTPKSAHRDRAPWVVFAIWTVALVWSGIGPKDRLTWLMEVAPVLIAAPVMLATRRAFPPTGMLLMLACLHGLILIVGGHYTYAEVPVGFWMQDLFGFSRNHYDRLGHFAQGFVPAILTREILLRRTELQPGGMLVLLVTSVCLAFSALYELIEWCAALILGQGADAFMGMQGDQWDTQADMAMALAGALLAPALLSRAHDRALAALPR